MITYIRLFKSDFWFICYDIEGLATQYSVLKTKYFQAFKYENPSKILEVGSILPFPLSLDWTNLILKNIA